MNVNRSQRLSAYSAVFLKTPDIYFTDKNYVVSFALSDYCELGDREYCFRYSLGKVNKSANKIAFLPLTKKMFLESETNKFKIYTKDKFEKYYEAMYQNYQDGLTLFRTQEESKKQYSYQKKISVEQKRNIYKTTSGAIIYHFFNLKSVSIDKIRRSSDYHYISRRKRL